MNPTSNKTIPETTPPKATRSRFGTQAFLSFATLALLISAIYVTLSNHQEKARQASAMKTLQDSIATLTQQLHQENTQSKRQQKALRRQIHYLTNRLETGLASTKPSTELIWRLKKVRDYLELAQINTPWGDEKSSRLDLLSAANQLLANNLDERIIPVNQSIEEAITKLNAEPPVNTLELLNSLEAAQTTLNTLSLKSLKTSNPSPQDSRTKAPIPSWQAHLEKSFQLLQQLIIVRHHSQDELLRLSTQDELLLREVFTMDLIQAKWAVLQKDTALYQQSLAHLIQILQSTQSLNPPNSSAENTPLQTLLAQLETLKHSPLTSEKPDLTPALTAVNEIINTNHESSH